MPTPEKYEYGERVVGDMGDRALRFGEGAISGYLAVTLGALNVLAVLCFRYPHWLTTGELREVYDPLVLRRILQASLVASLGFAVFTFVRNNKKRLGALGALLTVMALALGAADVRPSAVAPNDWSIGVDWLVLDLLFSAGLFIFVEKVFPKYPQQAIFRPAWQLDLAYFAVNHLVIGLLLLVTNRVAPALLAWAVNAHVQAFVRGLPLLVQVVLVTLAADLVQYAVHRAYHEVPALWKIHAVHHSSEHMDWLAGSRSHLLEILIDRTFVMVPLYLLGPDRAALDLYVVFAALQAVFVHANVGLPFGPFKYVVVTPQFHHWHHSSDRPAIDTNYAVHLPIIDMIFRTYHMPERHWPVAYGTVSPIPRTMFGQLRYPFGRGK